MEEENTDLSVTQGEISMKLSVIEVPQDQNSLAVSDDPNRGGSAVKYGLNYSQASSFEDLAASNHIKNLPT